MNNLCYLDLETTGLQIGVDRIISIGIVCSEGRTPLYELVNPGIPIPPEVVVLTDTTNEDVANAPPFEMLASRIAEYLKDCTLVGFNINNFDLPMLAEEMCRVGFPFNWDAFTVIDCGTIFKKKEERTLSAAVQFYCGQHMTDAHNALSDAIATAKVPTSGLRQCAASSISYSPRQ